MLTNFYISVSDQLEKMPLIKDKTFMPQLLKMFSPQNGEKIWECEGLKALTQLSLAVTLTSLRTAPPNIQPQGNNVTFSVIFIL